MESVVRVTAAGGAGSAVGTGFTETALRGMLEMIAYTYTSAPGTTTITITEDGGSNRTILAIPAGNTNGVSYVRVPAVTAANVAVAGSWVILFCPGYRLKVAVAASDPNAVITVRFQLSGNFEE